MIRSLLVLVLLAGIALAEPVEFPVKGFTFTVDVTLPVAPDRAFDLMTGDISGWWDHHFADHPKHLYIEPKPGGGFYEIFDDARNGVRHAAVTYAERGKRLRIEGPLGLAGRALTMVTTWDYEAAGDSTKVTATINLMGQIDLEKARLVESVWNHFLVEQLKPWVEKQPAKK